MHFFYSVRYATDFCLHLCHLHKIRINEIARKPNKISHFILEKSFFFCIKKAFGSWLALAAIVHSKTRRGTPLITRIILTHLKNARYHIYNTTCTQYSKNQNYILYFWELLQMLCFVLPGKNEIR